MGVGNGVQRKGPINDRFQRAGFETIVDMLLAEGKLLGARQRRPGADGEYPGGVDLGPSGPGGLFSPPDRRESAQTVSKV